jgi:hypothetical protein
VPQGHDREQADEPHDDDRGFKDTDGDVSECHAFVLPLEDGEQRHGGADIGNGEQDFEERPEGDPLIRTAADYVVVMLENRLVENECCRDRRTWRS